ncbi:hypothetical protein BDW22DRAFT_3230 [Trametopsis cervina]|nr:hypothetical protein BDW22DRAFT_3230 [Trametopsis cervina]
MAVSFKHQLYTTKSLVPQDHIDAAGLSTIQATISALISGPSSEIDANKALSLCGDLCRLLREHSRYSLASNIDTAWRGVFATLAQLMQPTQEEDSEHVKGLVNICLSCIEEVDRIDNFSEDAGYTTWLASFKPSDSLFPDEFISELRQLNPNVPRWYWRVRRLEDISAGDQRRAAKEAVFQPTDTLLATAGGNGEQVQVQPDGSKAAAEDSLRPANMDDLHLEDKALAETYLENTGTGRTIARPAKFSEDDGGDHVTPELSPDSEGDDTPDPSADFDNPVDPNEVSAVARSEGLNTSTEFVQDTNAQATVAMPHNISSLPSDTVNVGSSLQEVQLQRGGNGTSSASASPSGPVSEGVDAQARAETDSARTGLHSVMASTVESPSYDTSQTGLPPESSPHGIMHKGPPDIHSHANEDEIQSTEIITPLATGTMEVTDTGTRGTDDGERADNGEHSAHGQAFR